MSEESILSEWIVMVDAADSDEKVRFFRSITPEYYEEYDGNVEAPSGWFGIVRIDTDFREGWKVWQTVLEDPIPADIADGVYLVQIDSNGIVWAFRPFSEDNAEVVVRHNYDLLVDMYTLWDNEV